MNITEAKRQIADTVRAYLAKDGDGQPLIPVEKQRPVLIMGPPGIGKTAIMEQIAQELSVNLVSYTITHHTRQSAIGLPFISKRNYGGEEYSITEYTMSEIIASVYDRIEESGIAEGILFLDEINCVSETLSPTMLQFLQYKTFGTHRVPDSFIIVTAGNPPEYNASVRDFDIVTLDRVRLINVEADFDAWRSYATDARLHGAILAYLEIRKEHFYRMRTEAEGRYFVTARGWENLSRVLAVHEEKALPVSGALIAQFLQDDEIAESFAAYYELWQKYKDMYDVQEILAGASPDEEVRRSLQRAPFDEKLSLLTMLADALAGDCFQASLEADAQLGLRDMLRIVKESEDDDPATQLLALAEGARASLARKERAHLIDRDSARCMRKIIAALTEGAHVAEGGFDAVVSWFAEREEKRDEEAKALSGRMSHAFSFLASVFGEGQELVLFLTRLSKGTHTLRFVTEHGNDDYYRYNRMLLLDERRAQLKEELLTL